MEDPGHGPAVPVVVRVLPHEAPHQSTNPLLVFKPFRRTQHLRQNDLGLGEVVVNELFELVGPVVKSCVLCVRVGFNTDDGKGSMEPVQVGQFKLFLVTGVCKIPYNFIFSPTLIFSSSNIDFLPNSLNIIGNCFPFYYVIFFHKIMIFPSPLPNLIFFPNTQQT